MTRRTIIIRCGLVGVTVLCLGGGIFAYRAHRLYHVAHDLKSQVRYLIETGGTIGEAPASETFSANYLEAIFGSDPELLDKLKGVISQGLSDDPGVSLGEVAAMIVSYRKNGDRVENVVAHIVGGFPLGKRKPGFHRDGYFAHQLDDHLWDSGNTLLSFLGRDIVLFADEQDMKSQAELLEALYAGDIMSLVNSMDKPLYFTAVFPDPQRIVPAQLRHHIQAFILKGHLAKPEGSLECIFLTPSSKSADYALSILGDIKTTSLFFLRAKSKGVIEDTPWGPTVGSWWAYEMGNTLDASSMVAEQNLIRMKSEFERVMVNVVLKTIERMGRDMSQMRGSLEERTDPRLVDARLRSSKPLHYWSDDHQWGPDWPIPAETTNITEKTTGPAPSEQQSL